MARQAYRRDLNGAPRRAAKRTRNKNSRWMHLGAAAVGKRQLLQHNHRRRLQALLFDAWLRERSKNLKVR